jgi:protein TonB
MIQDLPPEIGGSAIGPPDGVVGGIPLTGPESAIVRSLSQVTLPTPPAPTRAAVQEPPKAIHAIQRIKIGGGVQEARLISAPRPLYPALARQARIQGTVHLGALIATDGRIAGLHVTSGHPLLVSAAMEAVRQWVYRPTLLNGDPVEVVTEISVVFTLQ